MLYIRIISLTALLIVCWSSTAQNSTTKTQQKVNVNASKSQASASSATLSANAVWVTDAMQKYTPHTWSLLEQYRLLPETITCTTVGGGSTSGNKAVATYQFLTGKTKIELLNTMGTNVHEVAHAFYRHNALWVSNKNNAEVNLNNAEGYIYVSPNQSIYVSFPKARMFQSKDLSAVIPAKRQTLRYSTYITGNTSTQSHGVIGLLNEFHAYYLGGKYALDMMPAYCKAESTSAKGFLTWVQHTQSLMDAYYELEFFIREYLLYMSENHPKSYAKLKAYKPFWQSFNAINTSFSNLNDQYQMSIRNQLSIINGQGNSQLAIEGTTLWLDNGSGKRVGVSLVLNAKEKLSARLEYLRKTMGKEI